MYSVDARHPDLADRPAELLVRRSRRRGLAVLATLALATAGAVHLLAPTSSHGLPWPTSGTAALTVGSVGHEGPGANRAVPIASVAKSQGKR